MQFHVFLHDNSRYNHIKIAVEDKEKTIFVTSYGTFYYEVMTFRLKNAKAT